MYGLNSIHILVLILGIFIIILQLIYRNELPENSLTSGPNIVVAVISARNHFSQRKVSRKSWIDSLKGYENVKYKFFIGKKCHIHPLDRLNKFSCADSDVSGTYGSKENSNIDFVPIKNLECRNVTSSVNNSRTAIRSCYSGFGFQVKHPLRLHSIGIRRELLVEHGNLFLAFKDAEEIFENIHVNLKSCSNVINGFCFLSLQEEYILPEAFEGMISLSEEPYSISSYEICRWKSDGTFVFTFGVLRNHYEKYQDGGCTNVIANFTLVDKESWDHFGNMKFKRQTEWQEEEDRIDNDLNIEMNSYGDVVYLHNVIDVYKNLPLKVLEAIKWSHTNYPTSFLFKADDDVEVDVNVLMDWISREIKDRKGLGIWSHFYYQRSVPVFGKWADFEFQGLTYPGFPCGSGYLLSDRLVYLLSMQAPFLRPFQGEDISIGIWTQVLRLGQDLIEKNHVDCWLPSDSCNQSIILSDVTPNQVNSGR